MTDTSPAVPAKCRGDPRTEYLLPSSPSGARPGPALWFAKDAAFDRRFRERFLALHETGCARRARQLAETADGALALAILLDQFPRNAFRGTARMYATDERRPAHRPRRSLRATTGVSTRRCGCSSICRSPTRRAWPTRTAVALCEATASPTAHARHHRDIVRRFGGFRTATRSSADL